MNVKSTYYDSFILQKTYSVTIVAKVTITTFSYSSTTIDKGKTSATPTKTITGTAKSGPTYSSSNTSIATVNSSTGVVTGVAAGTATITISYTNYDESKSTKTCNVTIKSVVSTITINSQGTTVSGYSQYINRIALPSVGENYFGFSVGAHTSCYGLFIEFTETINNMKYTYSKDGDYPSTSTTAAKNSSTADNSWGYYNKTAWWDYPYYNRIEIMLSSGSKVIIKTNKSGDSSSTKFKTVIIE